MQVPAKKLPAAERFSHICAYGAEAVYGHGPVAIASAIVAVLMIVAWLFHATNEG
jgi:hypothetical protein